MKVNLQVSTLARTTVRAVWFAAIAVVLLPLAEASLCAPTASPKFILVGRPTLVTITCNLVGPIPKGEVLLRYVKGESSKPNAVAAVMKESPGSMFTATLVLEPAFNQDYHFIVTAVETGTGRTTSPPVTIRALSKEALIGAEGGRVGIADSENPGYGTFLTIPPGALPAPTMISILSTVDEGNTYLDLQPTGIHFEVPALLRIPAPALENQYWRAYLFSDANLPLPMGVESSKWEALPSTTGGESDIYVSVPHFSLVALLALDPVYTVLQIPEKYMEKGDLLFALTNKDWFPGHVGMLTGEGSSRSVVESLSPVGVQTRSFQSFTADPYYMGARRHRQGLTSGEKNQVVSFALSKLGEGYSYVGNKSILGVWSCVGLTEAAYDSAGKSILPTVGHGLDIAPVPFDQFQHTVPVDEIRIKAGIPMEPIQVYGLVSYPDDRFFEFPTYEKMQSSASNLVSTPGHQMVFGNGTLFWNSPIAGTYTVSFFSTAQISDKSITVRQRLTITVTDENSAPLRMTSISVLPANPTLDIGEVLNLHAIAQFSNGSERDITDIAIFPFGSLGPISAGLGGTVWGESPGATTYIVSCNWELSPSPLHGDNCFFGTENIVSASTTITVREPAQLPQMTSFDISPINPVIVVGERLQFHAIARFSDGSEQDLFPIAVFAYDSPAVFEGSLDVPINAGMQGDVWGVAPGSMGVYVYCNWDPAKQNCFGNASAPYQSFNSSTTITVREAISPGEI